MRSTEETPQPETHEGYEVEIRFRGLSPFVPGDDIENGKEPSWVGAFLVDASAQNLRNFKVPHLAAHYPFLEYRLSDLRGMQNAPPVNALSPLKEEDIVFITPKGSPQKLKVDFSLEDLDEVPKAGEERFLNWVTPLDGVTPGKGEVDPKCFSEDPSPRVIARVHIVQGTLQVGRFAHFKDKLLVVSFSQGGMQKQRAVAKDGLLTIKCAPGDFGIRLKKFKKKDKEEEPTRELTFRQPPPGQKLKIFISNLCGSEVLPPKGDDLSQDEALRPDEDFRCNYIISKGVKDVRAFAVPVPNLSKVEPGSQAYDDDSGSDGSGGGSDGTQCSPPRTKSAAPGAVKPMLERVRQITQESV